MLKLIFFVILVYILYRLMKSVFGTGKKIYRNSNGAVIDEMVQDPVCETYIPRRQAVNVFRKGREYFFCSKECAEKFKSMKNGTEQSDQP